MTEYSETMKEEIIDFVPGAKIWFGKEKMHWRVLEVDRKEETALLITEKSVCEKLGHTKPMGVLESVVWEDWTLRKWLNEEYYKKTFSDEEREAVVECKLRNSEYFEGKIKDGKATKDRVFLLSIDEAERHFKDDEDRALGAQWWLRTPGMGYGGALYVCDNGSISKFGSLLSISYGVRPALRISLNSPYFRSLFRNESSGTIQIRMPQYHIWQGKLIDGEVTAENAREILADMAEYVSKEPNCTKKTAEGSLNFVLKNTPFLTAESVKDYCSVLREKGLGASADSLMADPGVAALFSPVTENKETGVKINQDGSICYGLTEEKVEAGTFFPMGEAGDLWRILDIDSDSNTALVIKENTVAKKEYGKSNYKGPAISWETSQLRGWLNGEYYENAFSEMEKAALKEIELYDEDGRKQSTATDSGLKDRITLLSKKEAERFYPLAADRMTSDDWWLRTPGESYGACYVSRYGSIFVTSESIELCVRPVVRINLNSAFFRSLLSVNRNGENVIRNYQVVIKGGEVISSTGNVTEVNLPTYVKKIVAGAFRNCAKLIKLTWQGEQPEIDKDAFLNCPSLRLPATFYGNEKLPAPNFAAFFPEDPMAMANVFLNAAAENALIYAAANLLTEENVGTVANEILKLTERKKKLKQKDSLIRFVLAAMPLLYKDKTEALINLLKKTTATVEQIKLLELDEVKEKPRNPRIVKAVFYVSSKIINTTFSRWDALPLFSTVLDICWDHTLSYEGGWVNLKYLCENYRKGALDAYDKDERADGIAAAMNHDALMALLKCWIAADGEKWYAPYAAYANDAELEALLSEMKEWEKDKKLRKRLIPIRGAVLLNDTATAARYADSLGLLEQYADMRNTDVAEIREKYNLVKSGKKK